MNNSRKGKKNKVKPGYGIADFFKFYKNNYTYDRYDIDKSTYNKIIKEYNQEILELVIFKNYEFTLPFRLGKIALRKIKPKVFSNNGTIINRNPINIRATLDLWEKDEVAKEKKIKVRYTNKHSKGYIFFIKYFKSIANYRNKSIYQFVFFRKVNSLINKAVLNFNIDTFVINNEK